MSFSDASRLFPFSYLASLLLHRPLCSVDNRHHWQDVLVGSILGFTISFVTYRGYYPPLAHRHSHLPYAPRELDGDEFSEEGVQLGNGSANARYERVAGGAGGGEERVVTRPSEGEDED